MLYQYDQLGRLISAATEGAGGWGLAWTHDGFGNLTQQSVTKGSLTGFTLSINGTTNRINGQSYDANGNWQGSWGQSQSYDIENRIRTASSTQHQETYLYSAQNERIVSQRGQAPHRVHFYGADGLLLGIYTLAITQNQSYTWPVRVAAQERVYFGGRLMQIGGEWVATDRLGSVVRKGTTNYKYAPYGQEIGGATDNDTNKFATYTRDSLSGLDYALNRYYKPEWGRFTSPDPYQNSAGPSDPGSWNRYTYVGGDPVNLFDPKGLLALDADAAWNCMLGAAYSGNPDRDFDHCFSSGDKSKPDTSGPQVDGSAGAGLSDSDIRWVLWIQSLYNPNVRTMVVSRAFALRGSNCGKVLGELGFNIGKLGKLAHTTTIWDTRSLSSDLELSALVGSHENLVTTAGGVRQGLTVAGATTTAIFLGRDFFGANLHKLNAVDLANFQKGQSGTLLHELLHAYDPTKYTDPYFRDNPLGKVFAAGFDTSNLFGSNFITQWLNGDCQPLTKVDP